MAVMDFFAKQKVVQKGCSFQTKHVLGFNILI
jgi:hypothetical protein